MSISTSIVSESSQSQKSNNLKSASNVPVPIVEEEKEKTEKCNGWMLLLAVVLLTLGSLILLISTFLLIRSHLVIEDPNPTTAAVPLNVTKSSLLDAS